MAEAEPDQPHAADADLEPSNQKHDPDAGSGTSPARFQARNRRVLAGLIDLLLVNAAIVALGALIHSLAVAGALTLAGVPVEVEWLEVFEIALFLLTMLLTGVGFGQSPGKWWTGLHVVTTRGTALTLPHRFWRHLARWSPMYMALGGNIIELLDRNVSAFPTLWAMLLLFFLLGPLALPTAVGWIFILSENDRTTFHDIVARTRISDPQDADAPGFNVVMKRPET